MQNDVEYAGAVTWDRPASHPHGKLGLDLRNLSTIVLEKTELMRLTLSGVLRDFGIKDVRATGDPRQAMEMMATRPADILFADWSPGLDGIGVLEEIRLSPESPSPYVSVIMVSANTEPRHVVKARNSGMTEYIAKPYTANRIYRRIWEVVERQRQFIRISSFFGPDRRRRNHSRNLPERRALSPC